MFSVMKIIMNDSRITNTNQIRAFLKGAEVFDFSLRSAPLERKYQFIDQAVDRLRYRFLSKRDKQVVIAYLKKVTGYKKAQLYRLISRAGLGSLKRKVYQRTKITRKYTSFDIKLLEKTDELHLKLNALATKEIMRREATVFGKEDYQTIAKISPSHLNNLRKNPIYRHYWINHTKSVTVPIGVSEPPENFGTPGSFRVDTVHQNSVYHINAVDEVTQWEIVACVPTISERFLEGAIWEIITQCPFVIFNFHSDRGGEYINYIVSELLNKLLIKQTKSRPRHPNDNALVETKNGAVIRKNMGWGYIDKGASEATNKFFREWFNPYLNYHRPSLFVTDTKVDKKGREKKIHGEATIPYEKLKEVSRKKEQNFLKKKVSFENLDKFAYQHSDNEFAKMMREKERKLNTLIQNINHINGSEKRQKGV